ncbi:MAG: tryptophan synthase subunit alpha, partial [Deltaproteobacteria bacterium]|nr:tryptophan synthase subunit alpha [Deltaproteobacteria bacterium]
MNRIDTTFEHLRNKEETALVGFVTAGDPNVPDSLEIIAAMCNAGLDVLELGVPFSDPTADGPVIQRSSGRALKSGVNLSSAIEMAGAIRKESEIPIILFSYYNPIHAYGMDAFYQDTLTAGADGLLVVDLPPEESTEMTAGWTGDDLALIRLVAPTTPPDRMKQISGSASGFLYLVSKTGVTGSSGIDTDEIGRQTASLRSITNLPVCVGFGISSAEDVAKVSSISDGVVIGSAFERIIEENIGHPDLISMVAKKVREYKEATRSGLATGSNVETQKSG